MAWFGGLRGELLRTLVLPGAVLAIALTLVLAAALERAAERDFDRLGDSLAARIATGDDPPATAVLAAPLPLRVERESVAGVWSGHGRGLDEMFRPRLYPGNGSGSVRLHVDTRDLQVRVWRIRLAAMAATLAIVLLAVLAMLRFERLVLDPLRAMLQGFQDRAGGTHELRIVADCMADLRQQLDGCRSAIRMQTREAARFHAGNGRARRSQDRLLAVVGDRLRQRLQVMTLFIDSLQRESGSPVQRQAVERLQQSTRAANELLDELRMHAQLEAGVVSTQPETIPVPDLFRSLCERMAPHAAEQGVELRWHGGTGQVLGDRAMLDCLLDHLLENAIRAAAGGRVLVAARRRLGRVRIEVRDNGIGIAQLNSKRIFDEFFQLDGGSNRCAGRLGLGLSICTRIAALLDSRIELRSELGRGSVFWFDLPRISGTRADGGRDQGSPASDTAVATVAVAGVLRRALPAQT